MIDAHPGALRRASSYFRTMMAGRDNPLRVPPFSLLLDPATADRYRNYAYPDDGADSASSTITKLIALFEQHERTPRLEYIPDLAPMLEAVLIMHGFAREGELPLMRCTRETLRLDPLPNGVRCELASSVDELREAADVQNAAYGAGPATTADTIRLRTTVEGGGLVAVARAPDGSPIGSGLVSVPREGVAEVAAVGVLVGKRRQGIGASVTAFLSNQALARGIDMPFLMAAHAAEARVYRRIGFVAFGTMLHIAR